MAALHGLTRGTLRVGTFASASIQLAARHHEGIYGPAIPGIRFELLCCWEFAQVEDLIRRGQADCGFLGLPVGPDLETYSLFRDRAHGHPAPGSPAVPRPHSIPMARFAGGSFHPCTGGPGRGDSAASFQQAGVRPNLHYTVNDDFAIQAMVEQGLGVSIQPELILQNSGHRFAAIPLEQPHFRRIWFWPCGAGAPLRPLPPALWTASAAGSARAHPVQGDGCEPKGRLANF
ncbi:MAG: LysR family transcriptional regulator substrate-binding protein [Oscillospiraceae bacterium]